MGQGKETAPERWRESYYRTLEERLVTYKQPRSFELVSESLRGDDGKVRRSALRAARIGKVSIN